jgi:hypothetical protein
MAPLSVLSIEQVLAEEASAIGGETLPYRGQTQSAKGQQAQAERLEKNATARICRMMRSNAGKGSIARLTE